MELFLNRIYATLSTGIDNVVTTLPLTTGHGARFGTIGAGNKVRIVFLDAALNVSEVAYITAITGDNATITRAQDGTTAVSHLAGDRIEARIGKSTMDSLSQKASSGTDAIAETHATTAKTVLVDADEAGVWDSVSSLLRKITFANIKATLKAYFDPIYAAIAGSSTQTFFVAAATAAAHAVRFDQVFGQINNIGVAGTAGFGVGICPAVPAGMSPMPGYSQPLSDNYGNYQYSDGSIMVWIPAFFYKYGTGANGFAVNIVDIKPESAYANEAAANAAGYALHRAFYDGGAVQRGVFIDKYKCSANAGIASSIKNGIPMSSNAANNPFSVCTANGQTPAQFYYGAIAAAKSRGNNFFSGSVFIRGAVALLSLSHAQASTSTTWCAWYHATNNFPKGCNNNALGDQNDAALLFLTSGYSTANKTGSANVLAKTTHNGQNCGVADVNGTLWEVCLGITSDATNFYILKTSAAMKNITASNTLATDAWGATGIAALYDSLGATHGALTASSTAKLLGSATQVFDAATSGNAWNAAGAGIPLVGGVGGTNAFGNDGIWDYRPNEMCPIVAGNWGSAAFAGVGALDLSSVRGGSLHGVGLRAALYL